MRSQLPILWILFIILLAPGCSRTAPELEEISSSFKQRYPKYKIRSITITTTNGSQKTVEIEFDAPDNIKNRGHANLIFEKQKTGSWRIIKEEILMSRKQVFGWRT